MATAFAGVLLTPVAATAAGAHAGARHRVADEAPLAITIDNLTPSALPKTGPVRVSGSVTNNDDQTWTDVNLYPFVSSDVITSTAELAEEADTDANADVGQRITDPGPYQTIDELAPGETRQYSFSVPRRRINASVAGVYWFGVHALGTSGEGRLDGADGRARTFIPLIPASATKRVDTALVLPIRHVVRHDPDGRVSDLADWTRTLSANGRLRALTELGVAAGDRPLTWLVDPAVTDAVTAITNGNPARSLAPTIDPTAPGDGESASPSAGASDQPSEDPSASTDDGDDSDATEPEDADLAAATVAGSEWLDRLHTGLEGSEILGLPYGDLDVSAAATQRPAAYQAARKRTGTELAPWGLPVSPAVAAPSGYLSPSAIEMTDPSTQVVVTDKMFRGRAPSVAETDGHALTVASSEAATGGPGPDDPMSLVNVRQRIVSEAALRLLTRGQPPLVVVLPSTWAPSSSAGFFDGLDLDWLHLTTVSAISAQGGSSVDPDRLVYPQAQSDGELQAVDFASAAALTHAGDTLQNLLTLNDQVGGVVSDEAMTDLSYGNRRLPLMSRTSAARSRYWIEQRLRGVEVSAPKAVILSSGSGRFSATVTNTLDEPVTVRLAARTDPLLRISVPDSEVQIGPGSRTSVLLNASSRAVGVRNATLLLTDTDGTALGSSDSLPIRSNQVSRVIWLILGTGVALLFGTILVRLFRRIRAAARS
ncbi:hypothetical protein ASC77_14415 [Nocardioides sp. Root1257]|nr:hypothetical protein ASC77_14415 [Nocardioides sp. Root1257]KRC45782.1 hypothetical protein ASE24_14415 [Nocardioides sp. Root224]